MPSARAAATAGREVLVVLGPEQAVLAAVRVDPRHRDPRRGDPHAPQVPVPGADRLQHPLRLRPVDRGAQRDVGRDVDDVQPLRGEQHPRRLLPGQVREQPGVAVVVVAGGVQRLLVDRRGDDARGPARLRPFDGGADVLEARPRRSAGSARRSGPATPRRGRRSRAMPSPPGATSGRSSPLAASARPSTARSPTTAKSRRSAASSAASALTVTSGPTPGGVAHGDHDRLVVRSGHPLVPPP